jgi:hypothetical protein
VGWQFQPDLKNFSLIDHGKITVLRQSEALPQMGVRLSKIIQQFSQCDETALSGCLDCSSEFFRASSFPSTKILIFICRLYHIKAPIWERAKIYWMVYTESPTNHISANRQTSAPCTILRPDGINSMSSKARWPGDDEIFIKNQFEKDTQNLFPDNITSRLEWLLLSRPNDISSTRQLMNHECSQCATEVTEAVL